MQKNVLLPLLILVIAGVGIFFYMKSQPAVYDQQEISETVVPDVSTDVIWNAYTLNGTVFIYPSDWTFDEVKDAKGKASGFKIAYPVSSNSFDSIEAGGACPEITIPEIHNACINSIWLHTQSENPVVLKVFNDMKTFGESEKSSI